MTTSQHSKNLITVDEAKSLINQHAHSFGTETIPLSEAFGRVLAENIFSDRDYPPFNRAAMDGYAIKHQDFLSGIKVFQVKETIYAGYEAVNEILTGECFKIMTGAAVPPSADCIIRVEDADFENSIVSFKVNTLKNFQNISKKGEDGLKDTLIIKSGTKCDPTIIGALAVIGRTSVKVHKLPTVSLISTGDEIKSIHDNITAVQIRDSNSYVLEAFLKNYQIPIKYREIVRDELSLLKEALEKATENSITIISGGVSAGDADFVPQVLKLLGVIEVFHKVKLKPGKPLWFGITPQNNVVFALPGNPVSVQIAFKIFIEPFLRECFRMSTVEGLKLPILIDRTKKVPLDEFYPACIINAPNFGVLPVKFNGSGDINATIMATGIIFQPADMENYLSGELVTYFPW